MSLFLRSAAVLILALPVQASEPQRPPKIEARLAPDAPSGSALPRSVLGALTREAPNAPSAGRRADRLDVPIAARSVTTAVRSEAGVSILVRSPVVAARHGVEPAAVNPR